MEAQQQSCVSEDFVMQEFSLRTNARRPSFRPEVVQLEQRVTPVARTTLASITNASPIIFSGQSALAVQFRLDTSTTYGTVVCFGFTNPGLVQNTQLATLQHFRNGRWTTIETVRPEATRIFLDRFGIIRTENPQDFRLILQLKPTLTAPVVDVDVTRFGFTGTNGSVTFRGTSHIRLVQTGRMLSTGALWYSAQIGIAQTLGDVNIGSFGPAGLRAFVFRPKAGQSIDWIRNVQFYRTVNGTVVGPAMGAIRPGANGSLVVYLYQRIDGVQSFRIVADVFTPIQISGLSYATT